HRDLEAAIKQGTFREDLFYRSNVVTIKVPPLRERREDIPSLVNHFLTRYAQENGKKIDGVSREAMDLLLKYDYPGNVRELENIVERAVVITRDTVIQSRDLPFGLRSKEASPLEEMEERKGLRAAVESLEKRLIEKAMMEANFNQSRAAKILGLSERMLRYKLKKYGFKSS
ncbi:MAG: helix-turn-helix domain-containing protein, partial [Candidatus Methanomethylicaceae archaeon]